MPIVEHAQQPWTQTRPGVQWQFIAGQVALDGEDVRPGLTMFYQRFEPGYGVPRHRHELGEEVLTVLEGEADVLLDGARGHVTTGMTIVVPEGAVHSFLNTGSGVLRVACVLSASALKSEFLEDSQGLPAPY